MSDLRDDIHAKPVTAEQQVFLDYHRNSPWAQAKVAAGIAPCPEAVLYMRCELAERARADAEREKNLKEDKPDAQQPAETHATEPSGERGPATDAVGGLPGPGSQSA